MKKTRLLALVLALSLVLTALAPNTALFDGNNANKVYAADQTYRAQLLVDGKEYYDDSRYAAFIERSGETQKFTVRLYTEGSGKNGVTVTSGSKGLNITAKTNATDVRTRVGEIKQASGCLECDVTVIIPQNDGFYRDISVGVYSGNDYIGSVVYDQDGIMPELDFSAYLVSTGSSSVVFAVKADKVGKVEYACISMAAVDAAMEKSMELEARSAALSERYEKAKAENNTEEMKKIDQEITELDAEYEKMQKDIEEMMKIGEIEISEDEVDKEKQVTISGLQAETKYTLMVVYNSAEGAYDWVSIEFTTEKASSGSGGGGGGSSTSKTTTLSDGSKQTQTVVKTGNKTITTTTTVKTDGSKTITKVVENKDGSKTVTETQITAKGTEKAVEVTTTKDGEVLLTTSITNAKGVGMTANYTAKGTKLTLTKIETKGKTAVTVPATVKCDGKTYKVTKIGASVLSGNKEVKKLTISKNVTAIGKKAFSNAANLKTVTIKSKVTSVGKDAFAGINKKATIKIDATKAVYKTVKKAVKNSGVAKTVKFKRI